MKHEHESMATHHHGAHDHASMMADRAMARSMEADMRRRFWVALALTIPIATIAGHIPGLPMLVHPPLASWLGLALSTPVVFWCGWIFLAGSVTALRQKTLDMSVLIATGVLATYLSSVYGAECGVAAPRPGVGRHLGIVRETPSAIEAFPDTRTH